jgi:oligoribonuclease (3'-5' exoribonuclease)
VVPCHHRNVGKPVFEFSKFCKVKYASIDIETLGLDPERHAILQVGAVIEDTDLKLPFTDLPRFKAIVTSDRKEGSDFAKNLNKVIIERIENRAPLPDEKLLDESEVATWLFSWLKVNGIEKAVFAGKNVGSFDIQFLKRLPKWDQKKHWHKYIDPAMLFVDWSKDTEPPSLDECIKRAGIEKTVSHDALEDAIDVVRVLRSKYY